MTQRRPMGGLEAEVLEVLWRCRDGATPSEVVDRMNTDLGYTTIMTILSRLWQKGLATRTKEGRAFRYRATMSKAELTADRMKATLALAGDRRAALSKFIEALSPKDVRALHELLDGKGPAA